MDIPLGFGGQQTADLTNWRGDDEHPGFRQIASAVARRLGVREPPEEQPSPGDVAFDEINFIEASNRQRRRAPFRKWRRLGYAVVGVLAAAAAVLVFVAQSSRCDISNPSELGGQDLSECDLRNANLSGANLSFANLESANLSNADLSDADLKNADLTWAYLISATLEGADLSNADLQVAILVDAFLRFANLSGTNLRNTNLLGAQLNGAFFLNDALWSGTTCPDGSNSNFPDGDGFTCLLNLFIF